MIRSLAFLIVALSFTACGSSGGGGGGGGGGSPGGPGAKPGDAGQSENEVACLIREPNSQVYYTGYGDSDQAATELAVAVCRSLATAPASCEQAAICEPRLPTARWTCTVRNTVTGDLWTDKGRSRVEVFSYMHGICSKGFNGNARVCQSLEQAACTLLPELSD